ncbi:MAG: cob(I)yrinic acid a,c-diamide adenosyltransferase [Deltaproteobacteria bacterium]|nr:cob(I)yrinic acid a,c-diamide adenosyltransferase [Deltaproteobacteria bacterium]
MEKKGLIHIYTGEGKGKTTASIGLAVRAAGAGLKVLFIQFFKEDGALSGEKEILRGLNIELIRANCRHPIFTKGRTDIDAVKKATLETYGMAKSRAAEGGVDLLVLDEIMSAVNGGWIEAEDLLSFLKNKPEGLEVALTGRSAPVELVEAADYVTEMLKIKHPYDFGINARKGIEF